MSSEIVWTAFLRTNSEAGAKKLISRVRRVVDNPLELRELDRYWKDQALYRCVFVTQVPSDGDADTVWRLLQIAGRIAPAWEVGGLHDLEAFWGWASERLVVNGVDSIGFALGSPPPEPGK